MKSRLIYAAVAATAALAGCAVVPVDGAYYSSPPAAIGYYGPPAVSHVWIGGTWSSYHHHGSPNWSPGQRWNHGGHWHGGGHWRGYR